LSDSWGANPMYDTGDVLENDVTFAEKSPQNVAFQMIQNPGRGQRVVFPAQDLYSITVNLKISRQLGMIVLAAVYFGAAHLGFLMAELHSSISPIWPATGIAVAALLLWGNRLWPAIFLGAFLANVFARLSPDTSLAIRIVQALGIAVGNTSEAVLGAWLAT